MNFAYLDARSFFESVLHSTQVPITPVPFDLDSEWTDFEKVLSNFKIKFAQARAELISKSAELNEKTEELNSIKMMIDNVKSEDLKDKLTHMLEQYESTSGISSLTQQCGVVSGKVEAMKAVLMNTNAERYAKFICFVCMERLVDLFIDPCGHVMCDTCWIQTREKKHCSACRGNITGVKKIFTI